MAKLRLDGELQEQDWRNAARTHGFIGADGKEAHPYSEASFLWDDDNLYLGLYAADEDIRVRAQKHDALAAGDDAFRVRLHHDGGEDFVFDIAPSGVFADASQAGDAAPSLAWESHAVVAVDHDGTLNDASDEDEEWVVEAAIPLAALQLKGTPGQSFDVAISRCDTPKGGHAVCGSYGQPGHWMRLALGPLTSAH
jgi:hypothetical protein